MRNFTTSFLSAALLHYRQRNQRTVVTEMSYRNSSQYEKTDSSPSRSHSTSGSRKSSANGPVSQRSPSSSTGNGASFHFRKSSAGPFSWSESSSSSYATAVEDDADLCCCEYINTDGERSHLATLFCDCDAIDEIFDRVLKRQPIPEDLKKRCFRTIEDRARLPRVLNNDGTGAVHVGCDTLLPAIICPVLFFLMATHTYAAICLTLLQPLFLVATFRCILRNFARSRFYTNLGVWMVAWLFLIFEITVGIHLETFPHCAFFLLFVPAVICLTKLKRDDPGYLTAPSAGGTVCRFCHLGKPDASTKHCRICDLCVVGRDHHCVWINNCVGWKNRGLFVKAIVSLVSALFLSLTLSMQQLYSSVWDDYYSWRYSFLFAGISEGIFVTVALLVLLTREICLMNGL